MRRGAGWRRWAAGLVTLALVGTLSCATSADAASARGCPSFSYRHHQAHGTYVFRRVRVKHARCRTVRRVVRGYFRGKGEPAGSYPTDGYNVFGWNVIIVDLVVSGRELGPAKGRFHGRYDFRPF